jgi:hypothetical protein
MKARLNANYFLRPLMIERRWLKQLQKFLTFGARRSFFDPSTMSNRNTLYFAVVCAEMSVEMWGDRR